MLADLARFALTQRLLVAVATLMLAAAGLWAFRALPIDAYPDVSSTQVKVIMKAPGMTPEEVEARITTPIELELLGIPRKRVVRSVSKYAIADVTLDFEEGTDIYWARQQVAERLGNVARDLPEGVVGGLAPITTPGLCMPSDQYTFPACAPAAPRASPRPSTRPEHLDARVRGLRCSSGAPVSTCFMFHSLCTYSRAWRGLKRQSPLTSCHDL